ncbi:BQ5605_C037g11645 [Microbotryum silenes-dioicae]|uniref:BQ5605_C019g09035 protein n=1 Tax=Microbotryum silenes-dioicae TaxID=796604 RepID=A0A2X0M0D2_9BASI|nr:BQ5605_C019g09035 [Microbotryum silenes-dioicae]SGY94347.1 BQ5605_C037g11645 [Microbotryum silenes-dioicae]
MVSRGSVVARSRTQTQTTNASRKRRRDQLDSPTTSTAHSQTATTSSSSNLIAGSSSSNTQARKKVNKATGSTPKATDQEKRSKRFRSSCPKNIQDRVARVWSQRFFCVDRTRTSPTSEKFSVLGSTGNVYIVTIDSEPACTCPDAQKGNFCKHILFVMLKVLQVNPSSNLWYQAALLLTELEEIFASARPTPQDEQTRRAQAAYRKVVGKEESDALEAPDSSSKNRVPEEGDACPVCYEDYEAGKVQGLVFCESCGNGLHAECFRSWSRQQNTCVMCRAPWVDSSTSAAKSAGASASEGYVNLGQTLGISPVRDTSTYHQPWLYREDFGMNHRGGSSRGHRWGTGCFMY